MNNTPTPHISAVKGDFAETVLMPGDPLRAKFIAETFLTDYVQVNKTRGILGYTGFYNGKKVSVMASGMGIPSMCIYSYELFNYYDVNNIIRVGTAGAIRSDLKIGDVVISMSACTDSNYAGSFCMPGIIAPTASFELLKKAEQNSDKLGLSTVIGPIFTSDCFYNDLENTAKWQKMGILCVEMETAGLYLNAMNCGKNALSILTISDCPLTNEAATAEQREKSFINMIKLALSCI